MLCIAFQLDLDDELRSIDIFDSLIMMQKVEFEGDKPGNRFGHTITPTNHDRVVMFGGAVGQTGRYTITSDTFLCHLPRLRWQQLRNSGQVPSSRAAHAAVVVEQIFFVFGGALGGGGLADDKLYEFNLFHATQEAQWSVRDCFGTTPGARYGHLMRFLKPFLIVHGGNTGNESVGDVWALNLQEDNRWAKVKFPGQSPAPRVYHSASLCKNGSANGMLVVFGGRNNTGQALNDTWGLRRHRNGKFDWMKAPYRSSTVPVARYQHKCVFVGTLLMVIGGRSNQVSQKMPLDIYDTDSSAWYRGEAVDRFRHAAFLKDQSLFIYGGLDLAAPNIPTNSILKLDLERFFGHNTQLFKGLAVEVGKDYFTAPTTNDPSLRGSKSHQETRRMEEAHRQPANQQHRRYSEKNMDIQHEGFRKTGFNVDIKLCSEAIVANYNEENEIKKVRVDDLPSEKRRVGNESYLGFPREKIQQLSDVFINRLLLQENPSVTSIHSSYIDELLAAVERTFDEQPTLMQIRYPVKVFGDIYGQLNGLNRLFYNFGIPDEAPNGDIQYTNYLFLGNYVDKGTQSIQTILLLFALKIRFPENFILLRGPHEDSSINRSLGFGDHCAHLFQENIDGPYSFFSKVNRLFEKMPLAALVENQFFCVHGGIGTSLKSVTTIEEIKRPTAIQHHQAHSVEDQIVYDLLWSDPCRPGEEEGPNYYHDYFQTKKGRTFSMERAVQFCNYNDIVAIIRSHSPLEAGFKADDPIITVFSCGNYGNSGNKAGLIHISKSGEVIPKVMDASGLQGWYQLSQQPPFPLKNEQLQLRQRRWSTPIE